MTQRPAKRQVVIGGMRLTMAKPLPHGSHFLVPDRECSYGFYKWKAAAAISVGLKIATRLIFPNVRAPPFPHLGKVTRSPQVPGNKVAVGVRDFKTDDKTPSHGGQRQIRIT